MRKPFPDFLCVGAPKSGTTSLHYILNRHPDIFLPSIKETNFFLLDELFVKGVNFYLQEFFSEYKGEKKVGEINPSYFCSEKTAERIYGVLGGNIKLIFMFRNPVDRAYSDYWMNVRRGFENRRFEEAITLERDKCNLEIISKRMYCYLSKSYYYKWLTSFLRFFPIKNMFFIIFETEFLKNRKETIGDLLTFLGVSNEISLNLEIKKNFARLPRFEWLRDFVFSDNWVKNKLKKIVNSTKKRKEIVNFLEKINTKPFNPPKLDKEFKRSILEKYFSKDIEDLQKVIKKDLSIWVQ